MTEAGWAACQDPTPMLNYLQKKATFRKVTLFASACCRRQWHHLPDEVCKIAVVTAERFADGDCTAEELQRARLVIERAHTNLFWPECCGSHMALAAYFTAFDLAATHAFELEHPLPDESTSMLIALRDDAAMHVAVGCGDDETDIAVERAVQCNVLRDLFGPLLFRNIFVDLTWRPPSLQELAERAYHERSLPSGTLKTDLLIALAGALEEAGCRDAELLSHLREPGPHYRGCWAVDVLTGR